VSLVRVTACAEHVRCMPTRWKHVCPLGTCLQDRMAVGVCTNLANMY
jgi:hypothetical protein